MAPKNGPDKADVYVGARVKLQRNAMGLSQSDLANMVGLTFQQIQKYENGVNRISASRLVQIAVALGVPVCWFFRGLDGEGPGDSWIDDPKVMDLLRTIGATDPMKRAPMVVALIGVVQAWST